MKKIRIISVMLIAAILMSFCALSVNAAVTNGDCDANGKCESDDAIYLLYHIFFGNDYPLPSGMSADFDGNGSINANDAIYLLYHIFFAEQYPLKNVSDDDDWTHRY